MTSYLARHARHRLSRMQFGLLTVLILAAGAISAHADTWWDGARPIVNDASPGERVMVEPVWVEVNDVRSGSVVVDAGREFETTAVWVALDVTAASLTVTEYIERFTLRDSQGREFEATTRVANPMQDGPYEPGVAERGDVVFEIPSDAVGSLILIVSPYRPTVQMPRAVAEISVHVEAPGSQPLELKPRQLVTEDA